MSEIGELWDYTKAQPGYIVNAVIQLGIFASVVQLMNKAFNMYPDSVSVVLVYGLVAMVSVDRLAPFMGKSFERFVNAFAEVYWNSKAEREEVKE